MYSDAHTACQPHVPRRARFVRFALFCWFLRHIPACLFSTEGANVRPHVPHPCLVKSSAMSRLPVSNTGVKPLPLPLSISFSALDESCPVLCGTSLSSDLWSRASCSCSCVPTLPPWMLWIALWRRSVTLEIYDNDDDIYVDMSADMSMLQWPR